MVIQGIIFQHVFLPEIIQTDKQINQSGLRIKKIK